MKIVKTTTTTYKVYKVLGSLMDNFGEYRKVREKYGLSVPKRCFCCGNKFKDEDKFILVTCTGGNKLFCTECADKATEQLKKESEVSK